MACWQERINVLIMDEAGNNLDIPTMTILEEYLLSFQGIVITVSHDRYFLDNVADRIFEFDGQGGLRQYEGGYTDYLEAKKNRQDEIKETEQPQTKKEGNRDWKGPRQAKVKFSFKEQREYETIDQDISDLEERISKAGGRDPGQCNQLCKAECINGRKRRSRGCPGEKNGPMGLSHRACRADRS